MKNSVTPQNTVNDFCLLSSEEVFAGSNTAASNLKPGKDEPSTEVEESDEAPLKGKGELDKTEDAASTPVTAQEQKQIQTLENGKIEGIPICFHLSYRFSDQRSIDILNHLIFLFACLDELPQLAWD
jgi:hypothetical protein